MKLTEQQAEELVRWLKDAALCIEHWGSRTPTYFQIKGRITADVNLYNERAELLQQWLHTNKS